MTILIHWPLICTKTGLMEGWKDVQRSPEHTDEELFGQHSTHKCVLVPQSVVSIHLEEIKKALKQLRMDRRKITDQQASLKATIGKACDDKKTQLISQLQQLTQDKLSILDPQLAELEAQRECCQNYIDSSTGTREVQKLIDTWQEDSLKPRTGADIVYSRSEGDWLSVPQSPDPTRCYASGNGLEVAKLGEKSTVVVHAVNYSCEPCVQPISASLFCKLSSEVTGNLVPCEVEMVDQSKYEISYQPEVKGRHCLHIKVNGQHIRGSPFSLAVMSLSVKMLNSPIHTITGVSEPCGVIFNRKQELVVSSRTSHCVYVFTPTGKKLRSFGLPGSGPGQFYCPEYLAMDRDGNILVMDMGNHRVQKFTEDGTFLQEVGSNGKTGDLEFDCPSGIAINNTENKVYVADCHNDRIQVLNLDLSFSFSFGGSGKGNGQFARPRSIACDSSGNIYVADTSNHRIQVFTADGTFKKAFGTCGQGYSLIAPIGITVSNGHVYISEDGNHSEGLNCRISVFTSDGVFVKAFGSHRDGPVQFHCPRGLVVDSCGVVYVSDQMNNRIQMF